MSSCGQCGQVHVAANGGTPCAGHVCTDRDSYVKGQDRKPLDKPRPCRRAATRGLDVCHMHGGAAPQTRAAAAQRDAEAKAEQAMRRFGGPIETTPSEALLDTVKWTAGYVGWLREKVAAVTSDERLVWGQTKRTTGDRASVTHEAAPNAWLELLGQWSDRLVKVCAAAISAGIEERKVRLAEAQGEIVAQVMRAILDDLHLTDEQQALVSEVVPRHLRAIAG